MRTRARTGKDRLWAGQAWTGYRHGQVKSRTGWARKVTGRTGKDGYGKGGQGKLRAGWARTKTS